MEYIEKEREKEKKRKNWTHGETDGTYKQIYK